MFKYNLKKITNLSVSLLFALSLSVLNVDGIDVKTFAKEISKNAVNETSDNSMEETSINTLNNIKLNGIYKNKISVSFDALEGIENYYATFGNNETFISNSENNETISLSFKAAKGSLITDDIKVYPITEDITEFDISSLDEDSCYSIPADSLKLIPVAPDKVTVSEAFPTLGDVTMSANRAPYADGVQYKVIKQGKKTLKKKTVKYKKSTTKVIYQTITGVDNKKFYKVKIRSYINFNGKKKYGAWETRYITNQVNLSGESVGLNNCISLKWDKIKGAKNYTIYASTKSSKDFKKIATLKGNKKNIKKVSGKNLSSGKKYYFYVIANKKSGGKTYSSPIRYALDVTYIK